MSKTTKTSDLQALLAGHFECWNATGDYCSVERSWTWSKPTQQPAPPIHVGSRASAQTFAVQLAEHLT